MASSTGDAVNSNGTDEIMRLPSSAVSQEPTTKSSRVKRATVVGNPMFSATVDESVAGGEQRLGLDDLDMDYEQIMHYFDNLKVKFLILISSMEAVLILYPCILSKESNA